MGNLVPFDFDKPLALPAHIKAMLGDADDLSASVGIGYPVLSIKGSKWTLIRNKDRQVIKLPNNPEVPAPSVEVVIIRANPNLSRAYYPSGYTEGSSDKPSCYSNDGTKPGAESSEPQAKSCAVCPHNVWGTGPNGKGYACAQARRIAVAPVGALTDPMLLRVPPASLKPLAEYGTQLKARGVAYNSVTTKISFDEHEATPKLVFRPVSLVSEDMAKTIIAVRDSEVVLAILGMDGDGLTVQEPAPDAPAEAAATPPPADPTVTTTEVAAALASAPEPAPVPKPEVKAAPAPAPAAKSEVDDEGLPAGLSDVLSEFDD